MFGTESAFTCQTYGVNKFIIIDDESHRFPPGAKIWCQRITVRG